MGRRVYEKGNFVWKYVFAKQNSEQFKIAEVFGIGEITKRGEGGDTLRLEKFDISSLEKALKPHLKSMETFNEFCLAVSSDGWVNVEQDKVIDSWMKENRFYDIYFWSMVKAYIKYMKGHPKRRVFYFEGEY